MIDLILIASISTFMAEVAMLEGTLQRSFFRKASRSFADNARL